MTLTFHLYAVLVVLAVIAGVAPFFIKDQGGYLGQLPRLMIAFACWPMAILLLVWAAVERFR